LGTNTLLGALAHCWERQNNVGSAATMCLGPETMLGASQHCFWSYHNVFGVVPLFLGFRDQDSRSCAEAGLFPRLQRLLQWIGRFSTPTASFAPARSWCAPTGRRIVRA